MAKRVIARLWNQFQEIEYVRRRPGQGHPLAATANNFLYVRLKSRRERRANAKQILRQFLLEQDEGSQAKHKLPK